MTIYQDTFTRANTTASTSIFGGWGSASDGESYSSAGAVLTWQILSNEGTATGATGQGYALLGTNTLDNADGVVHFEVSNSGDASGILLCYTDTNNYYRFRATSTQLLIDKVSGGVVTNLATATITRSANTFYNLRGRILNGNVFIKFWASGAVEPGSWTTTGTDATPLAAGKFGLFINLAQTTHTASFDNFVVQQPALSVPMRIVIATQKTLSAGVRMLVRTQKTVSMPVRIPIRVQVTRSLGMRINILNALTKSAAIRIKVRTQVTKTRKIRIPIRTQINKSLPFRAIIRTQKTRSLALRLPVRTQTQKTVGIRILVKMPPIQAVRFPPASRRTGQFPPTSRRTGQFPPTKRRPS